MRIGLTRAGVTGIQKAIRIRHEGHEKTFAAEISCTVDLDPAQKGVHMSRFPEIFGEAVDEVVIGEAFLVETLAEHIAAHVVDRQDALRAEVQIRAQYPLERRTPVTGLRTQEIATLIGIAAASRSRVRRVVGVEAFGINACPCAQGLVRGAASERLLEAGFADGDVERILELVPLATHNQRGRGTLLVGTDANINAEHLVDIVEHSMSSPIYELLKRPDELFVVEHAHLQPRFVEDSVRYALADHARALPGARRLRLHPLAAGEPRDDPPPRRPRGTLEHRRRAARRADGHRRVGAHRAARVAQRRLNAACTDSAKSVAGRHVGLRALARPAPADEPEALGGHGAQRQRVAAGNRACTRAART